MGGHLLLRILAERRPPLAAAVLVAPMIGVNASPIPPWLGRIAARTVAGLGLRRRRAWKENEKPGLRRHARQAYLTSSPERYADELWWRARHPGFALGPPSWGWLHAAYDSMARLTPETLAGVELPVLLLGTERDRLVSPTAIHRAAELLPHAELLMFPTAAHELLREDDSVRLAALTRIDAFLDEHAPA
jgi:lysophospholipase